MIDQICTCEYFIPLTASAEAKDLIEKILTADVRKRLSAQQILGHPWLAGVAAPDGGKRRASLPERGVRMSASQPLCVLPAGSSSGQHPLSGTAMMLIQKGNMHRQARLHGVPPAPMAELSFCVS
jgi:hypothetical protein